MILKIIAVLVAVRSVCIIIALVWSYRKKERVTKMDFLALLFLAFPDPIIIYIAVRYFVKGGF